MSWRARIALPRENVKNRRPHKLVLEGELAAIIERRWLAKSAVSEYIFHRNGKPIRDLRKAWAAACEVAGVPGRLFHDLRRSAVRNMVRAGVREGDAMATSGHRTRAIFDRYNITSDDDLREASRRTQEYLKGQPAVSNVAAFGKAASK
jgi:integrase